MTAHRWILRHSITLPSADEQALFLLRPFAHSPKRKRLFTEKDAFLLIQQTALSVGCATTPQTWWPTLCSITSFKRRTVRRRRAFGLFSDKVKDVLGLEDSDAAAELYDAIERRLDERQMTYLRERFSHQAISTEISGLAHLEASLEKGRGAILWNTAALGDTIVTKRALSEAGVPAYQLSVRSHGFSQSSFAVRNLNPGQIAVEDRYLAGRVWFDGDDAVQATREVVRLLKGNVPVLFANSLFAGRSFVAVSAGAKFYWPMATTPLSIAAKLNVPLHIVTTIEQEAFSRYITHISPALSSNGADASATGADSRIAALAVNARNILIDFTRANPDQIRLWDALIDPSDIRLQD